MSENTVSAALRSMGYAKEVMTAHGFRAMARTMFDEILEERVDLIEHQLAHAVIAPNGRAYSGADRRHAGTKSLFNLALRRRMALGLDGRSHRLQLVIAFDRAHHAMLSAGH